MAQINILQPRQIALEKQEKLVSLEGGGVHQHVTWSTLHLESGDRI